MHSLPSQRHIKKQHSLTEPMYQWSGSRYWTIKIRRARLEKRLPPAAMAAVNSPVHSCVVMIHLVVVGFIVAYVTDYSSPVCSVCQQLSIYEWMNQSIKIQFNVWAANSVVYYCITTQTRVFAMHVWTSLHPMGVKLWPRRQFGQLCSLTWLPNCPAAACTADTANPRMLCSTRA